MGLFPKTVICLLLTAAALPLHPGEVLEECNRYGGRTEVEIPEDTRFREYLKKFYDHQGFLVVLEEKYGPDTLGEVPYFLSRTYFSKEMENRMIVERFVKMIEAEKMGRLYKDISLYIDGMLVRAEEYYLGNSRFDGRHIRILDYNAIGQIISERFVPFPESSSLKR